MKTTDIEKFKSSLDIVHVIQNEGIALSKNGIGWKGLCPFHDDKNPSLSVLPEKGLFKCFGCNASGDVIKFIQLKKGCDFKEAVRYLGGETVHTHYFKMNNEKTKPVVQLADDHNLNELAEKYHQALSKYKPALEYLKKRGIDGEELINKFKIGYDSGYVTFPFFDEQGNCGEIYSRAISDSVKLKHKYLPGPHRGILGLDNIKSTEEIYLCECVIDALSLYQMGIKNVTCSFGKGNLTDELKEFLACHSKRVLIVYDNDPDNDESAIATAQTLAGKGLVCERVMLPKAIKDVNDYLCSALTEGKSFEDIRVLFKKLERVVLDIPKDRNSQDDGLNLLSDEHNILIFETGGKTYKVKGLKRTAQMDLHVLLSTEYKERKTLGKVDLLSEKSRERYSKVAKDRLEVSEFDVLAELEEMMIYLEALQEREYIKNIEEAKEDFMAPPYEITEERIQKAIENLTVKDYLTETLLEDLEYIKVVGEENNKMLYSLALISRFEDEPLHVLIIARSGIGKSYIQKMILKLFPEEDWIRISSLTKQVLYYVPKEAFAGKCISIDETTGIHEESFYTVRTFMSEGKLELLTTEKDANGVNQAKRRVVDGPVSILLSTTKYGSVDNETRSRMVVSYGDESEEQTKRIMEAKFFMNNTEEGLQRRAEIPAILKKHQDMMFVLRDTRDIRFVYENEELEKRVLLTDRYVQSRRNISIYTTLIRCIARTRVYRHKMETRDGKRIGFIRKDDVELAEMLMKNIITDQLSDLKGSLRSFYELIVKFVDGKRGDIPRNEYEFTRREIRNYTGWGDTQTKEYLKELCRLEYLVIARSKSGTATVYRLRDNTVDFG